MPGETQRDRDLRALDEAQARPCACGCGKSRAKGDHYSHECRRRFDEARRIHEGRQEGNDVAQS